MGLKVTGYTVGERILLPFYLLMANNFAVGIAGVLTFWRRREKPFWFLYWCTGLVLLCLHYTLIVGKGSTELFASIHRYTLPLVIPPFVAFSLDTEIAKEWDLDSLATKAFAFIFALALVGRGLEEVDLVRRYPLANRFRLCNQNEVYCDIARAIQTQAATDPHCGAWQLRDDTVFARYPTMEASKLSLLKISFMALPTRVYTAGSHVPPGAQVCAWP